jgi:hypothetical protein
MIERAHPLTGDLIFALAEGPLPARVLVLGLGDGRNVRALAESGARVDVVEEDPERALQGSRHFSANIKVRISRALYAGPYPFAAGFDGALSTHAFLHGSLAAVSAAAGAVRSRLRATAPAFFTLGSSSDPRCGQGERVDAATWRAADGPEAGVPHVYFDEAGARALLDGFDVTSLEEHSAAATAGRWAHAPEEAVPMLHWFVKARRGQLRQ